MVGEAVGEVVVGEAVQLAVQRDCPLEALSLEDFKSFDARLDESIFDVLDMDNALNARDHFGGTAPAQVRAACVRARKRISELLV